jgi:pyruvate carboxylase
VHANALLGDIVKVTPTSKVVGDLAQFMVQNKLTYQDTLDRAQDLDFPASVLDFFQGLMGQPYGGFPEPFRTHVLKGQREPLKERAGKHLPPADLEQIRSDLAKEYGTAGDTDVASYTQFPGVYKDYRAFLAQYGDLSVLPTRFFLAKPEINEEIYVNVEKGKTFIIKLLAVGPVSDKTGTREVYFEFNGETRPITVEDKKAAVQTITRKKADGSKSGEVGAPMSGVVVEVRVKQGAEVKKGDILGVLSAMKLELVMSAPISGKVADITVSQGDSVNSGDLIAVIEA